MHAGITALAPALADLTALEHLDLRKQHMLVDGLAALTAQLSCLSHLTCLELDCNHLALSGASELASAAASGALPSLQVPTLTHYHHAYSEVLAVYRAHGLLLLDCVPVDDLHWPAL